MCPYQNCEEEVKIYGAQNWSGTKRTYLGQIDSAQRVKPEERQKYSHRLGLRTMAMQRGVNDHNNLHVRWN